ncbi:sigma-70 family RNA polymerase sigma factor [Lapidilactobacillus salsurivasis]
MLDDHSSIIDYIDNNFRFGSQLRYETIERLFRDFQVPITERKAAYEELASLEIDILYSAESLKEKVAKLNKIIGGDHEISEEELLTWFYTEKIDSNMQKRLRQFLDSSGCKILSKKVTIDNTAYRNLLNEYNNDSLDDVFAGESFQKEANRLIDVIDPKYNLDYLDAFNTPESSPDKRAQALNNLVSANTKLVWKWVLRYKQLTTPSLDVEDLFQAGRLGLLKAAEGFDFSQGYQFSTYAVFWIRQAITREIANYSTTIRVPVHMHEQIRKFIKAENDFYIEHNRMGTNEELAAILDATPEKIEDLRVTKEIANLASLEAPLAVDDQSTLGDFVVDQSQPLPDDHLNKTELQKELQKAFDLKLSKKQARVLSFRFGLIDGQEHTLEEIGAVEGVTRERIRQIEQKALAKLSTTQSKEMLEDFYYD